MSGHGLTGTADAAAFLTRLTHLDSAAVVRLRSDPADRTMLWGRLPWSVLVCRAVTGPGPGDATVAAAELLSELDRNGGGLPSRRDADWRWPLPPDGGGRVIERVPSGELVRIAAAAAGALRTASAEGVGGRAVGERALRDALLDHIAIEVTEVAGPDAAPAGPPPAAGNLVAVPQRLVQAMVRMGFLSRPGRTPDDQILVRTAGRWVGLSGPYGNAWLPRGKQLVIRAGGQPNG